MTSTPAPASVRLVTPFARHSSIATSTARRISEGVRSGGATSAWALSTKTPVASPAASRTISPPAGAAVSREILARAMALALARAAWPSARSRTTGLSGETAVSA